MAWPELPSPASCSRLNNCFFFTLNMTMLLSVSQPGLSHRLSSLVMEDVTDHLVSVLNKVYSAGTRQNDGLSIGSTLFHPLTARGFFTCLFGAAVGAMREKVKAVQKDSAALRHLLPCRHVSQHIGRVKATLQPLYIDPAMRYEAAAPSASDTASW